eukprot:ANDGO_02325.mRNA.1 hypothetical protein
MIMQDIRRLLLVLLVAVSTVCFAAQLHPVDVTLPLESGLQCLVPRPSNLGTIRNALFTGESIITYVTFNGTFDDEALPTQCKPTLFLNVDDPQVPAVAAVYMKRRTLLDLLPGVPAPCDNQLVFLRSIQSTDYSAPLGLASSQPLNVTGCEYAGTSLASTFPPNTPVWPLTSVNPNPPFISMISSPTPSGTYSCGDTIEIVVTVYSILKYTAGSSTPTLQLTSGGVATFVTLRESAGTTEFLFQYKIQTEQSTPILDVTYFSTGESNILDKVTLLPLVTSVPKPGTIGSLSYRNATLGFGGSNFQVLWCKPNSIPPYGYNPALLPHLFCPYYNPNCQKENETQITVLITFNDIWSVDSSNENFIAKMRILTSWYEPRFDGVLSEDIAVWVGDRKSSDFVRAIWTPTWKFSNVRSGSTTDAALGIGGILKNGVVYLIEEYQQSLLFQFNSQNYPFDTQRLFVDMIMTTYDDTQVVFQALSDSNPRMRVTEESLKEIQSSDFDFSSASQSSKSLVPLLGARFATIRTQFVATRITTYTVILLLFPLSVIILCSAALFFVNQMSDSRFLSSGASLTGVLAFSYTISSQIPRTRNINRMSLFLFWTFATILFSFIWHITIRNLLLAVTAAQSKIQELQKKMEKEQAAKKAAEDAKRNGDAAGQEVREIEMKEIGAGSAEVGHQEEVSKTASSELKDAAIPLGKLFGCMQLTDKNVEYWNSKLRRIDEFVHIGFCLAQILVITLIFTLKY